MAIRLLRNRTAASLLDQAVVSGGNFFTTLILARSLAPSEYGTFTLLFLALFALNTCHSSLIIYPLTLRGAKGSASELSSAAGSAVIHTLLLSAPLACVLGAITLALHRLDLLPYLIVCMLFWQLQETLRRALLGALRFSDAILPDLLCYGGQALILVGLHSTRLSSIFSIVAITSLIAALWQAKLVGLSDLRSLSIPHAQWSWHMGRFILAGNALNMIALQWPSWILLASASTIAVANYQSLFSLAGFANPIIFSINSLLIPLIAREEANGLKHARATAVRYGTRYGMLLLPAFLALFFFPSRVMRTFYGMSSPYLVFAPLLRILIAAFALQYLATVVGAYEGGLGRPKTYMWVQIISVSCLLTLGTFLIRSMGVSGAVYAVLLISVVRLFTFLYLSWSADHGFLQLAPDHMDAY